MAEWLNSAFYGLDRAVTLGVDGLRCGFLNFISIFMAYLGKGGICFIIVSIILMLFRKTRRAGLSSLLAIGVGALLVNVILKPVVARPRPYIAGGEFYSVWERAGSHLEKEFSFPSGHTNVAMTAVTALFLCFNKKWSCSLLLVVPIMGFSRIYLGVHYFTDVLGGVIAGGISGVIGYYLGKFIFSKMEKYKDKKFCAFMLNADVKNLFKKN